MADLENILIELGINREKVDSDDFNDVIGVGINKYLSEKPIVTDKYVRKTLTRLSKDKLIQGYNEERHYHPNGPFMSTTIGEAIRTTIKFDYSHLYTISIRYIPKKDEKKADGAIIYYKSEYKMRDFIKKWFSVKEKKVIDCLVCLDDLSL